MAIHPSRRHGLGVVRLLYCGARYRRWDRRRAAALIVRGRFDRGVGPKQMSGRGEISNPNARQEASIHVPGEFSSHFSYFSGPTGPASQCHPQSDHAESQGTIESGGCAPGWRGFGYTRVRPQSGHRTSSCTGSCVDTRNARWQARHCTICWNMPVSGGPPLSAIASTPWWRDIPTLHLPPQRGPIDPQPSSGETPLPAACLKRSKQEFLLARRRERSAGSPAAFQVSVLLGEHRPGERVRLNHAASRTDHSMLQGVFQFPDVSRPIMVHENGHGTRWPFSLARKPRTRYLNLVPEREPSR